MKAEKVRSWLARIVLLLTALVSVLMMVSLFRQDTVKTYSIIYIPKRRESNDFWSYVQAGAKTAARENNVSLTILSPEQESDIQGQRELILEAIAAKPDVIALAPSSETELDDVIGQIRAARIPLVYIDSETGKDLADVIVATDNVTAGSKMAVPILPFLDSSSQIGIVSHVQGVSTAEERIAGIKKGLGPYADRIVGTVYSNSDQEAAYRETAQLLRDNPGLGFLLCTNEDASVGAIRAVTDLGYAEKIRMVGFDNSAEEIKYLERGGFEALVVQRAFSMGYLGIEKALELAKGRKPAHRTDSGSSLITQSNMYRDENQELLFPFYPQEYNRQAAETE